VDWKRIREEGLEPLVAGVKETQWGPEIRAVNQQEAIALVAKYHGLLKDRVILEKDVSELTDEQLEQLIQKVKG
jgi:hypothetical protein